MHVDVKAWQLNQQAKQDKGNETTLLSLKVNQQAKQDKGNETTLLN